MTLLGKIFTVLILIMSVLFLSFSIMVFATHQNWQELVNNPSPAPGKDLGLVQQIDSQRQANQQLNRDLQEAQLALKREQVARRFSLASLQSQLKTGTDELVALRKDLDTYEDKANKEQAKSADLVTVNQGLINEVENLRDQMITTQRDSDRYFNSALKLTDNINQLRGNKERLQEIRDQLIGQVAKYEKILNRRGIPKDDDVSQIPPALDGVVIKINGDLIQISIGQDDGLRKNHVVDVYRGKVYKGRIRIRETHPDSAVGEILPELLQGTIKKGDNVATRLSAK